MIYLRFQVLHLREYQDLSRMIRQEYSQCRNY